MKKNCLLFLISVSLFTFCINSDEPAETPIIRIEEWVITEPNSSNYANLKINTHENGSISCDGNWIYNYTGTDITCNNLVGSVYRDTSYYLIYCNGTASYISYYGEEEKSEFYLTFRGQFKNGSSSGSWEISFDEFDWEEDAPEGRFFEGTMVYSEDRL